MSRIHELILVEYIKISKSSITAYAVVAYIDVVWSFGLLFTVFGSHFSVCRSIFVMRFLQPCGFVMRRIYAKPVDQCPLRKIVYFL